MCYRLLLFILLFFNSDINAQRVRDFFYIEKKNKDLPVFVRGDISNKIILLFIQGGMAEKGIDFGRSDYPKWRKTLEENVAIAYFDQRGLNKPIKKIDTAKITPSQVCADIIAIARKLKEKYQAKIYLLGHSNGGVAVLSCMASFPNETTIFEGAIVLNTPITNDFSPERLTYYRPLFLKNLASDFIAKNENTTFWTEALNWMTVTDSISKVEDSKKWNFYVNHAFSPTKRKITLGMLLKVLFAKPYNPITYFNRNDENFIGDKLRSGRKTLNLWELLPGIHKPVLLLTGRYDPVATIEEQKDAQKLLPNSQLIILSNCDHESFLDQPELCNKAILNFIGIRLL